MAARTDEKRRVLGAGWPLVTASLAAALIASGCGGVPEERVSHSPEPGTGAKRAVEITSWEPVVEGIRPADDPKVPGVTIADARSLIGTPVPLPYGGGGAIEKAILSPRRKLTEAERRGFVLTIRYAHGPFLAVRPGTQDMYGRNPHVLGGPGIAATVSEMVAGREVFARRGWLDDNPRGKGFVDSAVFWSQDGYQYEAYSDTATPDVLPALREMVATCR